MMEFIIEHVHVFAGTPWWASIAMTAVLVRLVLLKPYIGAADVGARMAKIKHITAPVTTRMTDASRAGDTAATMEARSELSRIHARAGVKPWKTFVPMLQIFLGYGSFRLIRGMASLPVPGLETGGFGWITDLTLSDPLHVLPLATGAMFYLTMKVCCPAFDSPY